jgi:hypothetical protein
MLKLKCITMTDWRMDIFLCMIKNSGKNKNQAHDRKNGSLVYLYNIVNIFFSSGIFVNKRNYI